jgi:predicted ATP-binding protein involved in virulence
MIVTRLKLANVRGVEDAEFAFKPGFNLIVGVNGVGKTTALDALRICFSRVLSGLIPRRSKAMPFEHGDIRLGFPFLNAIVHFEVNEREFLFERREWAEAIAKDNEKNLVKMRREIIEAERLRKRPRKLLRELETPQSLVNSDFYLPDKSELQKAVEESGIPLTVFYSTNRSVIAARLSTEKSAGGPASGYAEALLPRNWNIEQFADWIRVQKSLTSESAKAGRHLALMKSAASRFLPDCTNITPGESVGSLMITKAGVQLDVRQLSDGERGVLGIALDLAQRLSQINPEATDPLAEGEAIVLIDEIDLHLHPKWQRQIVYNLVKVFPRCQFIATTHSPQIIGEVPPNHVVLIRGNGSLDYPSQTFGMDSNWILREIMESDDRNPKVQKKIDSILAAIREGDLDAARTEVSELRRTIGDTADIAAAMAKITRAEFILEKPTERRVKKARRRRK